MKVLMIFIDGFGLGEKVENNPYFFARTPFLDDILGGHFLYQDSGLVYGDGAIMVPTDALLGLPGIPQSATGQTTLWTGVNAAQAVGRHINAYPTRQLRELINTYSIMKRLNERGKKVTFANAYRGEYFELVKKRKMFHSTSTLVALSSGEPLRSIEDLKNNNAVYQDFTNRLLVEWGYDIEEITPQQAGKNLANVSIEYDFTLYEYFISDQTGHKRDMKKAIEIYETLDKMFAACISNSSLEDTLILIVSDHGNLEDLSCQSHTINKVPTLIIHKEVEKTGYHKINSLTDITPFVLDILCPDC